MSKERQIGRRAAPAEAEPEIAELSPAGARLFMRFRKVLPASQGMAIYGGRLFQLYHTGVCAVYDLRTRSAEPLAVFPLGSYNPGEPARDYTNHSNQCMFSSQHWRENPLPLLYVTTGWGVGADRDGFFYRCAVEDIRLTEDAAGALRGSGVLLQTVSYRAGDMAGLPWESPAWGCPAWFVDAEGGWLYILSARMRTVMEFWPRREENRYIVTRFSLPDPAEGGLVTLGPADIRDQFLCPFDILFTQGGVLHKDRIYYAFGAGNETYPDGLRVFDLETKRLAARMDLSGSCLGREELESCCFYKGELFCSTNAAPMGGLYSLGPGLDGERL